MATKSLKVCDVFGTTKDVKQYRIMVGEPLTSETAGRTPAWSHDLDLSPRGLQRLIRFVSRGVTTPAASEGLQGAAANAGWAASQKLLDQSPDSGTTPAPAMAKSPS